MEAHRLAAEWYTILVNAGSLRTRFCGKPTFIYYSAQLPEVVGGDQAKHRMSSIPIAVFREANARQWSHVEASCVAPTYEICSPRKTPKVATCYTW